MATVIKGAPADAVGTVGGGGGVASTDQGLATTHSHLRQRQPERIMDHLQMPSAVSMAG